MKVEGLIHVGARYAEELCIYHKHRIKDILWVEAFAGNMPVLKQRIRSHPGSKTACFAAGETEDDVILRMPHTKGSGLASLLPPTDSYRKGKTWLEFSVKQKRLDRFVQNMNNGVRYNVLTLDIQGAELKALTGATDLFGDVDAIITEFSTKASYQDQALVGDLDAFLAPHDFVRVQTLPTWALYHGDALYVKKKFADNWPM